MTQTEHRAPHRGKRRNLLVWLVRLLVLFVATTACFTAALLFYFRWLGAADGGQIAIGSGDPDLNPARRLYLQAYLTARASQLQEAAGSGQHPLPFIVTSGQSANEIAADLAASGLLDDQELFIRYLRYHGLDSELEAGTYLIDPHSTIPELALALSESYAQEVVLRFLEGWRTEEMADYIAGVDAVQIDPAAFLAIVQRREPHDLSSYSFADALPAGASLEGFLFPDTYRVPLDADAAYLVDLMLANFDRRVTPELKDAFAQNGLTLYQAVTLASIVERESPLAPERPLVAGVFYNRLEQEMRLEADPTVQYAVGFDRETQRWWKQGLTRADLQIDSPYNTYRYAGLPPGPIANPGLTSLQAVAAPERSAHLFFVADCNEEGAHLFSETYAEHLAKVEQCR